jgi:hypothetical protein
MLQSQPGELWSAWLRSLFVLMVLSVGYVGTLLCRCEIVRFLWGQNNEAPSFIIHGRLSSHEAMARLDLVEFEVHFMSVAVNRHRRLEFH